MECPFHNAQRLCQIQVERGETYLSQVCATYPRLKYVIDKRVDETLTLSCPESCRIVLLNPNLPISGGNEVDHMNWDDSKSGSALIPYFWPIREFVIGLMRNRAYPLWQRMFLLGTFARRLDAVVRTEVKGAFPAMFKGFLAAVESGTLRASIETIHADLTLQLGMVLELVKLRDGLGGRSSRLSECFDVFLKGIEYERQNTLESMSRVYGAAYARYFAPFFAQHPYILENYLINMIFRGLFPFGGRLFDRAKPPQPGKEYALLAINFALVKGLLIGVAGGHKEAFSSDHVVQTVQTVFKHFEHSPEFLAKAHQALVERRLDDAHGLTMLLRN